MSKSVRTFGSTVHATLDARPNRTGEPLAPMPDGHQDHAHEGAVDRWRVESFVLLADAEGQRVGKAILDARERRNTVRRRDRAGASAALTPEGRRALREAGGQVEAGRQAARMFARAGVAFRPAVADGFASGAKRIAEKGFRSTSAQEDTIAAGLLRAVGLHVMGEAVEEGPEVMTRTRSARNEQGVNGRVQLAGFRDLIGAAQGLLKTAAILDETATRAESVYREEEARRVRARRIRATVGPAPTPALEQGNTITTSTPTVAELVQDDAGDSVLTPLPGGEDHGRSREAATSASLERDASNAERDRGATSRDGEPSAGEPDEPTDTELCAFIDDQTFCTTRNRMVWGALANTPLPSGPNYPERRAEEARSIAEWDRRMAGARQALRMRGAKR